MNYLQLFQENPTFRIDSEYFKRAYVENISHLKKYNSSRLNKFIKYMSGGATPSGATYQKVGIPFLRVQNIMENHFNLSDVVYLNPNQDEKLKRSRLKKGDVLLTITGSYGKSATVTEQLEHANINQHSVKITLKENLNPYFLSTFFNSKFGKMQSDKNIVGITRPALDYGVIRNFLIPDVSLLFQEKVQSIILKAEELINLSEKIYRQAEQLLTQELGLQDFQPSRESINIKSLKESFGTSGRLDAEYYQKKYEEVVNEVKKHKHDRLANLVQISKSIEPGSAHYVEEGLPFIRVSDYDKFGITPPDKYLSQAFVKENEARVQSLKPQKDTILFSKDGRVGTAYHLREDQDFITSGAILHLKIKDSERVLPEYLTLVLNSKMVKMQAERDAGGSIILHWRLSEIENVVVPILDREKQNQIAALIEESFSRKKQSEHLLQVARQAVEKAIEESEAAALAWEEA